MRFVLSMLMLVLAMAVNAQIPSNGLVAWYPFNGNANDESGNGNDGVVNGATLAVDRYGNANGAYSFDGVNSLIEIVNSTHPVTNFDVSYSLWYKCFDSNQDRSLISVGPACCYNNRSAVHKYVWGNLGYIVNGPDFGTSYNLVLEEWHHVVFTKSGLEITLYVDGILNQFGSLTHVLNIGNSDIHIGGNGSQSNNNGEHFLGILDDISIYNRALNSSEIQQLYQDQTGQVQQQLTCNITAPTTTLCAGESVNLSISATGGAGSPAQLPANLQQGLVAYYPFNGNANDESGNGFNGSASDLIYSDGRFGQAAIMNGQNTLVQTSIFGVPVNGTLSLWLNPSSNNGVILNATDWCRDFSFELTDARPLSWIKTYNCNSVEGDTVSGGVIQLNEWNNIIFSWGSQGKKIYVNGSLVASNSNTDYSQSMQEWEFGSSYNLQSPKYSGFIDDVMIWGRALTNSEIQQLYTAQSYTWSTGATNNSITVSPTTNNTYSCTVTQGNSTCTASIDITVNPAVARAISASIIEGGSYTLGTQNLTVAGTYTEVFTSTAGCDSTVTLTLAVEPLLTCNITAATTTLCSGESVNLSISAAGGAGSSSQLPANLQQGLVAYYPFNGNANDESGNGNNGTVNGATLISDRFGSSESAFNFNSNYIEVLASESLNSQEGTINFWMRTSNQNLMVPIKKNGFNGATNEQYSLAVNYQDLFSVKYNSSCVPGIGWEKTGGNNSSLTDGSWHFVSASYSNTLSVYIDGVFISSLSAPSSMADNCSGDLQIGREWNNWPNYFFGDLDDIAIYNRALSPSEIQQLYTAQSFTWNTGATTNTITVSPTSNTTYSCTVTQGNQTCTASIDITVNPAVARAISASIIEGESYTLGTQTLTTAGTYIEVFTSAAGCDSTVTLTLAVEPLLTCNITAATTTLCSGESVDLTVSNTEATQLLGGVAIGDQGPGGGIIYFDKGQETDGWRYLEALPYDLIPAQYGCNGTVLNDAGGEAIGSGLINTLSIVEQCADLNIAAKLCMDLVFGGKDDWFLPSRLELYELYLMRNFVGGFVANENYWTSTQQPVPWPLPDYAYFQGFQDTLVCCNGWYNTGKDAVLQVRPIRYVSESELVSYVWSTGATTNTINVSPTNDSTYTCTVNAGSQTCTTSVDITVSPQQTFYADADGDGYGNPQVVVTNCNQPAGYVTDNTDCNDNDAAVYVASTETCNGLDDNCDGQVDEGLTLGSVTATSVTTALYPTCSGNALKSANLNNGINSPIIDGNGLDLWYSLTAQYNTLRAGLSAAFGDNEIRLYSYNSGCFELMETEHEVYTASTAATGNQVLITDDLLVGQTYYIAVHNISGPMNSSAKMCFNHFVGTTCDHYYSNYTGVYNNVCTSFKAQYKGNATNYIFDILSATQNNVNLNITPWSYTTTTANSVVPRLGTIFPVNMSNAAKVYTLRIPVIYEIPDAAGNYTSITANATTTCTVTLNAELPIALRAADRCPNTKTTTSSISVDRTICGAQRYEWEFTQQLPSVQSPVSVLGGLNTTVFFLNNVPGMGTGKTYNVRVRPIHANGEVGNWGAAQCLKTVTSGMVMQSESNNESGVWTNNYSPEQAVTLYPNPTSTGHFTLMTNSTEEEVKQIVITDITGKMVFQSQVVMNGNAVEVEFGDLATGMYLVMVGEERLRLVVE